MYISHTVWTVRTVRTVISGSTCILYHRQWGSKLLSPTFETTTEYLTGTSRYEKWDQPAEFITAQNSLVYLLLAGMYLFLPDVFSPIHKLTVQFRWQRLKICYKWSLKPAKCGANFDGPDCTIYSYIVTFFLLRNLIPRQSCILLPKIKLLLWATIEWPHLNSWS